MIMVHLVFYFTEVHVKVFVKYARKRILFQNGRLQVVVVDGVDDVA